MKNITNSEFERTILEKRISAKKRERVSLGYNLFITVYPWETEGICSHKMPFSVRQKTKTKDTMTVIGYYPDMSLLQAQAIAKSMIKELKKKNDAESEDMTAPIFKDAFEEWYKVKITKLKVGSTRPKNIRSIMNTTIIPSGLAELRITDINPKTIAIKLASFNQTAGNIRSAISITSSCLQYYYIKGQIPFNPIANLLSGRESPYKKNKPQPHKYIDPKYIFTKFFAPLAVAPTVKRVFYLYLMLTGFRFGEARLAHWSWFDFEKNVIVIPPNALGANKTQTEYIKPMTRQIRALMLNWKKNHFDPNCDFVFKSSFHNNAIYAEAFRKPVKELTTRELDLHGIRTVVRSWLSSKNIHSKIAELALQHDVRSKIEKVYDKYTYVEEMREALQKWNDYVESQLPEEFLQLIQPNDKGLS